MDSQVSKESVHGSADRAFWCLCVLFLLSGLSSLIYQVSWTRMLVFVFGSGTFASSTVLSVFMGGLGLGSYLASRVADRLKRPLVCYGILELIIGVWALLTPLMFEAAIPLYKAFFPSLHNQIIVFSLLRFLVATVVLLLPTSCMGATLPILARFVTKSLDEVGDKVGNLYSINTLGAVVGSIIGGYLFLPCFGLLSTTLIAASTNLLLGLFVIYLAGKSIFLQRSSTLSAESAETLEYAPTSKEKSVSAPVIAVMSTFAVSGALAMIFEVAWTRALLMVIGSTTYAFTTMLSAFLIGIYLGSRICSSFVDKLKAPIIWLALILMCLCLAGFLSLILFDQLPFLNLYVWYLFKKNLIFCSLFKFISAGLILLPISFLLGMTFPLSVKTCALDLERVGSSVGKLYSVNTLGAILGSFLAGFVVIPFLGSEKTLILTSISYLITGVILLAIFTRIKTSIKLICVCSSLAALFLSMQSKDFWDYNKVVTAQVLRRSLLASPLKASDSLPEWFNLHSRTFALAFYKEGQIASVAIRKRGNHTILFTNGHIDASNDNDMENQAMVSVLPLLLKPEAEKICIVGWGSGVTAGYALQFPVQKLICAEIEPAVLDTSPFFYDVNFKPEKDKRTNLEFADGRNFLLGSSDKFDHIVSEPSNPWQAGVCNLFTTEYFRICHDSLKDNGIFAMWTQLNEVPTKNLGGILASLRKVFPCIYVMDAGKGNVTVLAFPKNVRINYQQLKKTLASVKLRQVLKRFKISSADDFIARIIVCPDGVDQLIAGMQENTDDTNHLEYEVARKYEQNLSFGNANQNWLQLHHGQIWNFVDWGSDSKDKKAEYCLQIANAALKRNLTRVSQWVGESMRLKPSADALSTLAVSQLLSRNYADFYKSLEKARSSYPEDFRFAGFAGVAAYKQGRLNEAIEQLSIAHNNDPSNHFFSYYLALCYTNLDLAESDEAKILPHAGNPSKVIEYCKPASMDEQFVDSKPGVLAMLADAYKNVENYAEAENTIKRLLKRSPKGFLSWQILGQIYGAQKEWSASSYCWNRAFYLGARDVNDFLSQTQQHIDNHQNTDALHKIRLLYQMAPADPRVMTILKELSLADSRALNYYNRIRTESGLHNDTN